MVVYIGIRGIFGYYLVDYDVADASFTLTGFYKTCQRLICRPVVLLTILNSVRIQRMQLN